MNGIIISHLENRVSKYLSIFSYLIKFLKKNLTNQRIWRYLFCNFWIFKYFHELLL